MTAIRALDQNQDWEFGKGKSSYKNAQKAIILNIETKLREWDTDCFFAQNNGIDWKTRLGTTNQKALLDNEIRRLIVGVEGVLKVNIFTSSLTGNRKYIANFNITTIYSTNTALEFNP